jgi:hypothetical protein
VSRAVALAFAQLAALACGGDSPAPAADAPLAVDAAPPVDAPGVVDGPPPPDGPSVDAPLDADPLWLLCTELRRQWRARAETLGNLCAIPSDCAAIGRSPSPCSRIPTLAADCAGDAVTRTAYEAARDELDPLAAEFNDRCGHERLCELGGVGCGLTCDPEVTLSCVHATCVAVSGVCAGP